MKKTRIAVLAFVLLLLPSVAAVRHLVVHAQSASDPLISLAPDSLKAWLSVISSDAMEGRATYSEGLALAASYISSQIRDAGVRPGGDDNSYFQRVNVLGVRSTNRSSLTVEVNGQVRTFRDGEGITFPKDVGGKRTLTVDDIEFVGYGLNLGPAHNDYHGLDMRGKVAVWIGDRGPASLDRQLIGRSLANRESVAIEEMESAATIAPSQPQFGERCAGTPNGFGGRGRGPAPDFTTTERLDLPRPPSLGANDEFFDFLFSGSSVTYADLRAKSDRQEDLAPFRIRGAKLTFSLDADYQIVETRYTRNVVGMVEGSDPALKSTYVAFGAHYDHLGYQQGANAGVGGDRIYNGADDDGSGTTALIALSRTFATGPRPRRSLLFVWHAGEECGLLGSEYFADHPVVPLDRIVSQLNIDMIGRDRDNLDSEENTVYAVGADRISSELHNVLIDANNAIPAPLNVDFEMNDPLDPERIYFRSDHYSYAAKGIPVIFFFTGLHPDYHEVSDSVDKIHFNKMAKIVRLVYETGRRLADLNHAPIRDFKGPRMGRGASGKLPLN